MANGDPTRDPTQAMLENVRFMRENGYSKDEIDAEIKRWAPKIAAFNAAEMQREDPMGLAEMSPAAANIKAGARAGLEALQTVAAGFPGRSAGDVRSAGRDQWRPGGRGQAADSGRGN